ncbi:alcohol dehydrogenase catalytic domain-containing protein [Labedella endophytica]|nr:alcohol dehydrogenase catalytic domain-containing protein [Labedella endophytica]
MRATRHPTTPTVPGTAAPTRRDVIIRPAPLAMVWQGPGAAHATIAVPGVSLGEGDVLVAVELATICPSDAAAVLTGVGVTAPLVLGHEQVGRIVAVGLDATTSDGTRLVVGMRVVWSRRIGCGECASCSRGATSDCRNAREYGVDRLRRGWELSGGFASHVLVRAGTTILTVPEVVPAAVLAPLSCATALAAAAVEHIGSVVEVDGQTVIVAGADLVGLTVAAMLADEGAHAVVVEPDATRRSRALDFGAHGVAAGPSEVERLLRAGRASVASGHGTASPLARPIAVVGSGTPGGSLVDAVWVADTSAPDREQGDESAPESMVDVRAVVNLREVPDPASGRKRDASRDEGAISPSWPIDAQVVTLQRTDPRHLVAAVDFASNAWFRYPFADLVSDRYPLERLDDALSDALSGSALRIGIEPGGL